MLARSASAAPAGRPEPIVQIANAPSWVEPRDVAGPTDTEPNEGIALELLDNQTRYVSGQRWMFMRGLLRITSEVGAQQAGQRRFYFTPPHERLVLHTLEVRREGSSQTRLNREAIQILQREPGLESSVYSGQRTAVVVLSDLRVGDRIFYEFSIVGSNPVLAGHATENWYQQLSSPIGSLHYRLLSDKPLTFRTFGSATPPEVVNRGRVHEYRWHAQQLAPAQNETAVPSDHDALPWVQFSSFGSWSEVAVWGSKLFRTPHKLGPDLQQRVRQIADQHASTQDRVLAVLRWIQTDIRYLSLAFAESSHRPAPPDVVFERRFGDCKDKSHLMVTVLRALGIDANVALVDADWGGGLHRVLPSAQVFDHAIVSVFIDGQRHFVDPTRLYQRGGLEQVAARDLHYALLLAPEQSSLTKIEEPQSLRPDIHATLTYRFARFGGPISLEVSTTYTGSAADFARADSASNTRKVFAERAAQRIKDTHPRASLVGEFELTDNEASNELTVRQKFDLPEAWTERDNAQVSFASFPPWLSEQLPNIGPERKHPYAIEHPSWIVHDIYIVPPEPIQAELVNERIETGAHTLVFTASNENGRVQLHYDLRSTKDRLEPSEFATYRQRKARIDQQLEYLVWASLPTKSGWPPASIIALTSVWIMLLTALVAFVQRKKPFLARPGIPFTPRLAGHGGWLALLGLGVTFSPIRILVETAELLPAYSAERWHQLTSTTSLGYHAMWAPVLLVELLVNLTLIFGSFHLAYLYWRKHRSFPLVFVSFQAFSLVFITADSVLFLVMPEALVGSYNGEFARTVVESAVGLAWTLYVLNSKRVKATFLPAPDTESDTPDLEFAPAGRSPQAL